MPSLLTAGISEDEAQARATSSMTMRWRARRRRRRRTPRACGWRGRSAAPAPRRRPRGTRRLVDLGGPRRDLRPRPASRTLARSSSCSSGRQVEHGTYARSASTDRRPDAIVPEVAQWPDRAHEQATPVARLTVIGTGYLGATHAVCMAELGYEVSGSTSTRPRSTQLSAGEVPFYEPGLAELLAQARRDRPAAVHHRRTTRSPRSATCTSSASAPRSSRASYAADLTLRRRRVRRARCRT